MAPAQITTLSGRDSSCPAPSSLAINDGIFSLLGGESFQTGGSFTNAGTLLVDALSAMNVTGNFTTPGILDFAMGGTSANPTIGAVQLAGTLTVTDKVKPSASSTLPPIIHGESSQQVAGAFANSTVKVDGLTYDIDYLGSDVALVPA